MGLPVVVMGVVVVLSEAGVWFSVVFSIDSNTYWHGQEMILCKGKEGSH